MVRKRQEHTMHIHIQPGPPLAKTMSFAAIHFSVAFSLAYLLTGNFVLSGTLAIVEPMVNTVAYFFHEVVWARWRRCNSRPFARSGSPVETANSA
jgi:uncharacterized membrane protein